MNLELYCAPVFTLEQPKRVVDVTMPFFDDYGYRSTARAIRAVGDSLYRTRIPHLVFIIGEPVNGKQHELLDINSRLHQGKRSEGVLTRIGREQGYPVPVDVVYWGNSFSVAKIKGRIPMNKDYGQFDDREMQIPVEEYEGLISRALTERKDKPAVIFAKAVGLTGIWIDRELRGRDRGVSVFKRCIDRKGPFKGLKYKVYFFGEVADPEAVTSGSITRTEGEKLLDQPAELVRMLKDSGEAIITDQGGQPELTSEQQQAVVEYISEGANIASSDEIIGYDNLHAITLSEMGRFRINGIPYRFDPFDYYFDGKVWKFTDPQKRMEAVGLLMRYMFEDKENLGLRYKVFIGKTCQLDEVILDLQYPPRNVAKAYYPDIVHIKNK